MEFNTQDLLAFCAYYNTTKAAVRLPLNSITEKKHQNNQTTNKQTKTTRKKMEVVQPKKIDKIVKTKVEQVPRRSQKRSLSPIQTIDFMKQPMKANNNKYDLDYFMKHMTDRSHFNHYNQLPYRQQNYDNPYSKSTQNYDTFGRSGGYKSQYQTYEQKMKRQNNKYSASTVNRFNNQPKQTYVSKFMPTQSINNYNDNWPYNTQTAKKTFIVNEQKKIPFVSQYSPLHQNQQIKMTYSPSARNYSPGLSSVLSSSWMKGSPGGENNLSKSRSKHQRKKSQRPFYDASKLTLKADQPQRQREQHQLLSQSFVSINQSPVALTNNPRKQQIMEQNSKRQTSTTAPPRMNNKQMMRSQRQQIDLDDDLGDTLSELQRHPPIALQVKIKSIP